MRDIVAIALVTTGFAFAGEVVAGCECGCVNGQLAVICRGSTQAAPQTCAPRVCPAPQPSAAPVVASSAPPPGTTQCLMAQVLDPKTNQYQWVEVCR